MKNVILVLMCLVVVGCVPSHGAPEDEESKVAIIKQGEVFRVFYVALRNSVVQVTISDKEGNKIFSEQIEGNRFMRPYNFSQLPKGDYVLQVQDQNTSQTEMVCHHDKPWMAQLAKMRGPEKKYLVTMPRQQGMDMIVSVFDQHNELVYSELVSGDEDFAKIYNLKNLIGSTIQVSNKQSGEAKLLSVD